MAFHVTASNSSRILLSKYTRIVNLRPKEYPQITKHRPRNNKREKWREPTQLMSTTLCCCKLGKVRNVHGHAERINHEWVQAFEPTWSWCVSITDAVTCPSTPLAPNIYRTYQVSSCAVQYITLHVLKRTWSDTKLSLTPHSFVVKFVASVHPVFSSRHRLYSACNGNYLNDCEQGFTLWSCSEKKTWYVTHNASHMLF